MEGNFDLEQMLLTPRQAREFCGGVALSTWGYWCRKGRVKPAETTKGGHRRFRVADLRAQLRLGLAPATA